jgi:hypothetical protein
LDPSSLLPYWYFHAPNYALAVMQYAAVGWLLLGLFVDPNWSNYIFRGFKAVASPAVATVRFITPAAVPPMLVVVFTVLWLTVARAALFVTLTQLGLAPRLAS